MAEFTLALIQMQVEGGDLTGNLDRAEARISKASSNGAQIALLPEVLDVGWTYPKARELAQPVPTGKPYQRLAGCARKHHLYVCAGLTERAGDQVYNTAVLIDPAGQLRLRHRKINELDIGQTCYDLGDRLNVCQTEFGSIGVIICADGLARDQVLSRSLGYMGAQVILSPSAWAVPPHHDNIEEPYGDEWRQVYQPVARDFCIWFAAASNVGWITGGGWDGWKCIGCSLVIGPDGEEILQGPYGHTADAIIYTRITPETPPARGTNWERIWGPTRR